MLAVYIKSLPLRIPISKYLYLEVIAFPNDTKLYQKRTKLYQKRTVENWNTETKKADINYICELLHVMWAGLLFISLQSWIIN